VDKYSQGIDVPTVDTVLMLRPAESAVVSGTSEEQLRP
jgi:hypothetical protein